MLESLCKRVKRIGVVQELSLAGSVVLALVIIAMMLSTLASFVPFIPGPVLVWGIGAVYAAFTGLDRVTFWALLAMTGIMAIGSTADFWMQLLGVHMEGGSCLATLGSIVGGTVTTFIIPIPIIGTVIGMVLGALAFEFMRQRELDPALKAGKNALNVYLLSVAVEFTASILILLFFLLSIWYTA